MTALPIIDLARSRTSVGERAVVAQQVDEACRDVGFLYLTGHGLAEQLIEEVWAVTTEFFDQSIETKARYVADQAESQRGWTMLGRERHAHTLGQEGSPDLFEAFSIGNVDLVDDAFTQGAATTFFGKNIWPETPERFRSVWERYHRAVGALSEELMSLLASALGLSPDWFEPVIGRATQNLRALRYPELDSVPEDGQFGIAPHTDYGSVTLLLTDGASGLQIESEPGSWTDVPHVDGAFVINLGDLMPCWTNDRWRSTMHRVVRGQDLPQRQSIAYFCAPNYDAVVETIPTCLAADGSSRYGPFVSGEWIYDKRSSAYGRPVETAGTQAQSVGA